MGPPSMRLRYQRYVRWIVACLIEHKAGQHMNQTQKYLQHIEIILFLNDATCDSFHTATCEKWRRLRHLSSAVLK